MTAQLELQRLRAGYGAINVLWDVSIQAPAGQTTVIVGPNGAGKSTLLKSIMGLVPTAAGAIYLDGAAITNGKTWDLVSQGLVLIPEGRLVFPDMTVRENLLMGAFPRNCRPLWKQTLEWVYELFPRLAERQTQAAGSLSGGEAQMLSVGRGLMEQPRVLLIDEPSLGLAPVIVAEIFRTLAALREQGLTILLVEQNTARALDIADHVYVMRSGDVVLSQPGDSVNLEMLHDVYFARSGNGD